MPAVTIYMYEPVDCRAPHSLVDGAVLHKGICRLSSQVVVDAVVPRNVPCSPALKPGTRDTRVGGQQQSVGTCTKRAQCGRKCQGFTRSITEVPSPIREASLPEMSQAVAGLESTGVHDPKPPCIPTWLSQQVPSPSKEAPLLGMFRRLQVQG